MWKNGIVVEDYKGCEVTMPKRQKKKKKKRKRDLNLEIFFL